MYEFEEMGIRTTSAEPIYPSEAVQIDGTYLEDAVPGYRTLQVQGRELSPQEIKSITVGDADGDLLQGSRNPSRTITVMYQLICDSNGDFRDKFHKLNSILHGDSHQVVFHDEPDKYWQATMSDVDTVPGGRNSVTSTFTLYIPDGLSHALTPTTTTNMPYAGVAENLLVGTTPDKVTAKTLTTNMGQWGYTTKTRIPADFDSLNVVDGVYTFSTMIYSPPFDMTSEAQVTAIDEDGTSRRITRFGSVVKAGAIGISVGTIDFNDYENVTAVELHSIVYNSVHADGTGLDVTYSTPKMQAGKVDEAGMNLLMGTKDFNEMHWVNTPSWSDTGEKYNGLSIFSATNHKYGGLGQRFTVVAGKQYTFSVFARAEGTSELGIFTTYGNDAVVNPPQQFIEALPGMARYHLTFTATTDGDIVPRFENVSDTGTLYVAGYALKQGTDATYSPSPYDYVPNVQDDNYYADTIELTNHGTVPTPVNIETEFDHDNGYFAASLDDRYYQVGRPTEVDVVNYQQNETLIHDSYASDDELSSYTKNSALHRYNPTGTHQQGEFMTVVTGDDKRTVLQVKNTGTLVKGWQGPALTKTIPADSNGVLGVKNPALEVYLDFYATNNLQSGILEINLTDANDKFVAGVLFRKPAQGHKHIEITFYAGNKAVWTSKNDARWDNFRGRVSIYKFNNHFWFGLSKLERGKDNHTVSFNYYDDTLKDLTATKYHIWASHWQDQKFMMIELFETKLVKQNVDKQANVANFFSPGDKLLINSEEYKTYINDVVDLDNVATGSKPLILPPQSTTTLALATSEFGHLRKVTATYRERWI